MNNKKIVARKKMRYCCCNTMRGRPGMRELYRRHPPPCGLQLQARMSSRTCRGIMTP